MKLTNNQYDKIKQFLLMIVPGASALLAVFAGIALNYIAGKYDKEEL